MSATQVNATVYDTDNCTLDTCPIDESFYAYVPALPENSFYILLFGISFVIFNWQAWKTRTWLFHSLVVFGCVLEIIGYVGRVQSHFNVFDMNAFLTQVVCLTIAPAFFSAAIYICLSKIVSVFGNSQIAMMSSRWYSIIFVIGDFLSLCLQSLGGGMASIASQDKKDPTTGNHIMLAGLAMQVAFLTLFAILAAEFAVRVSRNMSKVSAAGIEVMATRRFKVFIGGLIIATLGVYVRSVYRVIELAEGWKGHLISVQAYFMVLEGLMIIISSFALNIAHPGYKFPEGYAKKTSDDEEKSSQV